MAKNLEVKKDLVSSVTTQIKELNAERAAYVLEYSQMSATEINKIRRALEEKGAKAQVVKNTLISKIFKELGIEMDKKLEGQNLVIVPGKDFISPLKDLFKFIKDNSKGSFKAGTLSGKLISGKEIESLSKLPTKEVLLGQLLGVMQAPTRNFAVVLNGVQSNFVRALSAIKDKKS
jgi:large subunit ribosomal protein L10